MAKEYFSHDYDTRADEKIKTLIRKHGMVGYGIFWALVEDLYHNANALRLDCEGIAYDLRTECEVVKSVINDFGLFEINGEIFSSISVGKRLLIRDEKSSNASKSANKRWGNATALPTQSDRNAIKEIKVKEIKVNKKINSVKFSFSDSEFFDKEIFSKSFPDWSKEKKEYYYESARIWSENNPSKKMVNWADTIKNWDRRNPWIADQKKYNGKPQTANQQIHDLANNGVFLKPPPDKFVEVIQADGQRFTGNLELDNGLIVFVKAGRTRVTIDPQKNFHASCTYQLAPGRTIQEVYEYLINEQMELV